MWEASWPADEGQKWGGVGVVSEYMSEFDWEVDLKKAIREGIERLSATSVRPTTDQERRDFIELTQLGYISLSCDKRTDGVPWTHFPKRLIADIVRLEANHASLWNRFSEMADEEVPKLKRKIAQLESKKPRKARAKVGG